MPLRFAIAVVLAFAFAAPAVAAPRDDALRVAPPDAAIVLVVQNLRAHATAVSESPFAAWFPTSALGKQLLGSAAFKNFTETAGTVLASLGLTPADILNDIAGDAVVFAYSPGTAADPNDERSVILLRPRKLDTLTKALDTLNDIQMKSKELKAVATHQYAGATYYERQKAEGPADFYCFRGGVFAFSSSEADIKAVIDRDASAAKDKPPVLVARMTKLGVADAVAVVLINPRPLDAEFAARVKTAKPAEKAVLATFANVWAAIDAAAVYLTLDAGVELGVSLQFTPGKLPAGVKGWLTGDRTPSTLWAAVPDDALIAVAGRMKPNEVLAALASTGMADGEPGVSELVAKTLGPVIGKNKLPLVLDALGPDWGVWAAPPAKGTTVPVIVGAVKVDGGVKSADAAKALTQALEYGFQSARIAYNADHTDQMELSEEKDGDVVIKSLSGSAFPAGFRPCFALKGGYLLISTSPDAIKAFRAPTAAPKPGGVVPLVRFNATATRAYLTAHAGELAKLLATAGAGEEKALLEQLGGLAAVLEPAEKVELLVGGDATGLKVMLRAKLAKPLKK